LWWKRFGCSSFALASGALALQSPPLGNKWDMNGTESKIEIFKPFGEAFELTKKILFQPFDLKKWFVIGFAAWLASLGGGGGSFNYQPDGEEKVKKVNDAIEQIPHPILVACIVAVIVLVLALVVVFAWLRARGGFMFIDCIVKNRGGIAEPWRYFRREGNSYFLFSLLVVLVMLFSAGLLSLPLVIPAIQNGDFLRTHDVYLISAIAAWVLVMVFFVVAWGLITSFMIPLMYRQRCRAWEAFMTVIRLIAAHTGEIVLYCLFWIVLALASLIVGCIAACATCCIAAIPYVGTVILLPVFVLLRSFSLLFLRQFGPECDVWAGFMPPEFAAILMPVPTANALDSSGHVERSGDMSGS
jgi:hypothetical protein